MMDNLNLKPQSPDEVKTMMWTGENQREMFDLLTCGKKIDDYITMKSGHTRNMCVSSLISRS
jgi:hypothetical protein